MPEYMNSNACAMPICTQEPTVPIPEVVDETYKLLRDCEDGLIRCAETLRGVHPDPRNDTGEVKCLQDAVIRNQDQVRIILEHVRFILIALGG